MWPKKPKIFPVWPGARERKEERVTMNGLRQGFFWGVIRMF